ncbi:phage tail tube protein [Novosphingobium sp. 9]|uniref:phage tail tube protein n=1 Tax=Novosphingobium sp. 9 TaxID=2025349 RepID=UPI0021B67790|nr:phage tail tube protein [Novosphingobium sp. 9]
MTDARMGSGSRFWLADASAALTELDELTSIGLPNPTVDDVEATHMKSPNRRREYIAGLITDGEGTFGFNLVPGSDTDLLIQAALEDGVTRAYEVVIPDGAFGQSFKGELVVKGYERTVPIDDRMTATLTVRFSGAVTITTLTAAHA